MAAPRLTLGHVFALMIVGLTLLLGLLFTVLVQGSRRSIIQAADSLRIAAGRRIEERVGAHLAPAEQALEALEREIRSGTVDPSDTHALEAALFSHVLNAEHLAELTLTRARRRGFAAGGAIDLEADGRSQISVYRVLDAPAGRLVTREVAQERARWRLAVRDRPSDAGLLDAPLSVSSSDREADPTEHPT